MSDAVAAAHWKLHPAAPYAPTHRFEAAYVDAAHEAIMALPRDEIILKSDIPGWLQVDDALKLYELAYFSDGDVLELGTFQGLSTAFIASALLNAGGRNSCDSIELDPQVSALAFRHLDRRDLNCVVMLHVGDGAAICRDFAQAGRTFGFAFVDHSHGFEDVLAANQELKHLIRPGGFALFHDYTDPRNSLRTGVGDHPEEFGVRNACDVAFADGSFEFLATCGACGLYRRAI